MFYSTPAISESQAKSKLPWYASSRSSISADGAVIFDVRSDFRRTVEVGLAEDGRPTRDNAVLYDLGQGGIEIQYSPEGWQSADKLTRPRDITFSWPGHWDAPSQAEIRRDREAQAWYVPAEDTCRLRAKEAILRRPTGWHPPAGSSPNYMANRLKNAQKAKARCRRLIRKYWRYVRMWTLTFAENEKDVGYADKCFRAAMRRFHDHFKAKGEEFHYLGVREFQERGAIHYHIFVSHYIPKLPKPGELSMDEVWKHGYSFVVTSIRKRKSGKEYSVQTIFRSSKNGDALARYLHKYIVKCIEDPESAAKLEGHHLYLRSQGMFIEKVALWTSMETLVAWALHTGRKLRKMWKVPIEIQTDRGAITKYHYRLDLGALPSTQT